jgi:hypothetical protein
MAKDQPDESKVTARSELTRDNPDLAEQAHKAYERERAHRVEGGESNE